MTDDQLRRAVAQTDGEDDGEDEGEEGSGGDGGD